MDSRSIAVTDLRRRSYAALVAGAREVHPRIEYDAKGYACQWQENVLDCMPITAIAQDFGSGAGRELDKKLCAAHSSAALVINTFGRWRTEPESLRIAGVSGFRNIQFEMTFPTGLGGTPPHLDLFADGDSIVAVESKCTEWMDSKPALFSYSYDRLLGSLGDSVWFDVMQEATRQARPIPVLGCCAVGKARIRLAEAIRLARDSTRVPVLGAGKRSRLAGVPAAPRRG